MAIKTPLNFGLSLGSISLKLPWMKTAIRKCDSSLNPFNFKLSNSVRHYSKVNLTATVNPNSTGDGTSSRKSPIRNHADINTNSESSVTKMGSTSAAEDSLDNCSNQEGNTKQIYVNKSEEEGEDMIKFTPGDVADYFDLSKSFKRSEKWQSDLVNTMLVYPNFISLDEEAAIMKEIEPYLSRLHYESSHWDDAIHDYRETERSKWNKTNEKIINRTRQVAFPPEVPQLKLVHILDLAKKGVIKPHIDSIRFCGNTITGLSLLSDSVMRLQHDVQKDFYCDIYLPRLSLYVMKNFSRYEFTHEIMGEADSKFQNRQIQRDRRVSIICRNEPEATSGSVPVFNPLSL